MTEQQDDTNSAQAGVTRRPYRLIPPPVDFTGRENELVQLLEILADNDPDILMIRGVGGVGKTALARAVAAEVGELFPDVQLELDLRGAGLGEPLTPAAAMTRIIHAIESQTILPDDPDALAELYRSLLAEKRALLLLDNARNAGQVAPLLPPTGSLLLVTTRWRFDVSVMSAIYLEPLPEARAITLLHRKSSRLPSDGDALPIAELCGNLPEALCVAAGTLNRVETVSLAQFSAMLTQASKRLEPVGAAYECSYQLLGKSERRCWADLSVFPTDFDLRAATVVWGLEEEPGLAREILEGLVACALVRWDAESGRASLHDLAREFAASKLNADIYAARQAENRHATHYARVLEAADDLFSKGGEGVLQGLSLFDREWPNIEAGQAWASSRPENDDAAARLTSSYPDGGVHVLDSRLSPRQRVTWLEAGLVAARHIRHRSAEAHHLGNLGVHYAYLGETRKATKSNELALYLLREMKDRWGEGHVLWNMALAQEVLGERENAIEFGEEALVVFNEIDDSSAEDVQRKLDEWRGGVGEG